jgi:hypothetical protein
MIAANHLVENALSRNGIESLGQASCDAAAATRAKRSRRARGSGIPTIPSPAAKAAAAPA